VLLKPEEKELLGHKIETESPQYFTESFIGSVYENPNYVNQGNLCFEGV
jgi:hypothetical protein